MDLNNNFYKTNNYIVSFLSYNCGIKSIQVLSYRK